VDGERVSAAPPVDPAGPAGDRVVSGASLAEVGVWVPRRRPEQVLLFAVEAVG
jgi:hypothetical protein